MLLYPHGATNKTWFEKVASQGSRCSIGKLIAFKKIDDGGRLMLAEQVNNLEPFYHPVTERHYRHMTAKEVSYLVEELSQAITEISYLPLVSVESGANPLGKLVVAKTSSEH